MRRVRPYQGPANSPSDEPGLLDSSSLSVFAPPAPVRRPRRFKGGPFLPGAQWGPSASPPDDDPPDAGLPGRATLQVPRVPVRAGVLDAGRLRRHAEVVEVILNSLLRRGRLYQLDGADEFDVVAPGFSATRDPGASDDSTRGATPGVSWTNRVSGKVFFCTDATAGAAQWVQVN